MASIGDAMQSLGMGKAKMEVNINPPIKVAILIPISRELPESKIYIHPTEENRENAQVSQEFFRRPVVLHPHGGICLPEDSQGFDRRAELEDGWVVSSESPMHRHGQYINLYCNERKNRCRIAQCGDH